MALELKVESLRARGELTAAERDRLLAALRDGPALAKAKPKRLITPLRMFLLGVISGLTIAYLLWGYLS